MEQFISSGKNRSKYDAIPFVKNDTVELSRLGRVVPTFTKLSAVGEIMARVRCLQMVQLIPVILLEMKREEYLRRHSFYSGKFHRVEPFHLTFHLKKKTRFFFCTNGKCSCSIFR